MTIRPRKRLSSKRVPRSGKNTESTLVLCLYVAGASPNSVAAIANLKAMEPRVIGSRLELEIVDVLRKPERALSDAILVTPTLVKISPRPTCRILGNLRDTEAVLRALGVGAGLIR
jgi:circadian clock protein KaiB